MTFVPRLNHRVVPAGSTRWVGVALAAGLAWGCAGGDPSGSKVVERYLEAVQSEDLDTLFCLSAGATESEELGADGVSRRRAFGEWAAAYYELYLAGRDAGQVELEGTGIPAVKLFALGRGTFYRIGHGRHSGPATLKLRMDLRFGYGHIDLSRFSPGTTLYFGAVPPGRVEAIRVPGFRGERSAEVLEEISLDWTLTQRPPAEGCPGGWAVVSVEPIEGSAKIAEVSWKF